MSNKFHLRPEYLITVMLAKSILKNNIISTKISDFSLLLEDSTSNVFTRRFNEIQERYKSGVPKKLRNKYNSEKIWEINLKYYRRISLTIIY